MTSISIFTSGSSPKLINERRSSVNIFCNSALIHADAGDIVFIEDRKFLNKNVKLLIENNAELFVENRGVSILIFILRWMLKKSTKLFRFDLNYSNHNGVLKNPGFSKSTSYFVCGNTAIYSAMQLALALGVTELRIFGYTGGDYVGNFDYVVNPNAPMHQKSEHALKLAKDIMYSVGCKCEFYRE